MLFHDGSEGGLRKVATTDDGSMSGSWEPDVKTNGKGQRIRGGNQRIQVNTERMVGNQQLY